MLSGASGSENREDRFGVSRLFRQRLANMVSGHKLTLSELPVGLLPPYGWVMSDNEPLHADRVMGLVGDALTASMHGTNPAVAASWIIATKRPTQRELVAARRENQELHGGGTPDVLRQFLPPIPIPEEIARLRRMIDDVLAAIERQLNSAEPG